MNQDGEFRPSPIKGLPVELLQMILRLVPDVQSLHAAVLSCSSFYHAFWNVETTITTEVLLNQIDVGVLPEAMLTAESALLPDESKPKSYETANNFAARNLRQRPTPPRSWSLQEALRLSRLHFYVDALAKKFVETTLTKAPFNQPQHPVTNQEMCRIQRALYRFQLFRNLERTAARSRFLMAFFDYCENEQLFCIYFFLTRAVLPAFDDVAEHDVAWGAWNIQSSERGGSSYLVSQYTQFLLSLGLEKVYEIASAETYEQRYRALDATRCPRHSNFLYWILDRIQRGRNPHIDFYQSALHLFFDDPDSGPRDARVWSQRDEYYYERLCEWGYVM
ncbi:hypothetical protein F4679DRAFT_591684 [Xylaria curta]|nr:hypothetical protein F4679DRAFT_591684 [Xylaria curta]